MNIACIASKPLINQFLRTVQTLSRANWQKRNNACTSFKGEVVTASCCRWRIAVISVIPHFFPCSFSSCSLRSSLPPPNVLFCQNYLLQCSSRHFLFPFATSLFLDLSSSFFFTPSLSHVDCIRLCAVSSTFFACSPTVIDRKKDCARGSIYRHAVHEGGSAKIKQIKGEGRGRVKVSREKERKGCGYALTSGQITMCTPAI